MRHSPMNCSVALLAANLLLACSGASSSSGSVADAALPDDGGALDADRGDAGTTWDAGADIPADAEAVDGASDPDADGPTDGESGTDLPDTGVTSACRWGRYEGTFIGSYSDLLIAGVGTLVSGRDTAGQPEWLLVFGPPDALGNLPLVEARAQGEINLAYPIAWTMTGELICSTGKLTGALQGSYSLDDPSMPVAITGTIDGVYDVVTHSLQGTWQATNPPIDPPLVRHSGVGTWKITRPPTP